ncbi:branched-chain alpha-keto acid dehydrogenase subunit E2 [Heyndrickxia shackletonii]|uniref:Dihydrolipoamide acetyltransferase component of pyruvate dehydrogenase complex n=1 Tax=Heyndrickxia shackletonii TaxID=157838 RepID=A0A0Q3WW47_9BACI|nr:dihydrolipoamide acetyltransferase family protein [Heyndrickxia shackletonii]KQL52954.1 branched-chain alpha-keto acid dehydrogenase subunit E2 [Heyndrickxia shackletonii]NEY98856.1 2-oxo acid dehydrogenase subunit E2 [Heyndrickxia shackletonii]
MAKEIFMPKLSSTMEVGTLLQWFKEEGDPVSMGDPLFEIMTDKINIEVESYEDGFLLKKYFQVDDEIPVNQVIGYIGEKNEQVPNESPGISTGDSTGTEISTEPPNKPQNEGQEQGQKIRATPAARRIARENYMELSLVTGSGPNGRIQEKDVQQLLLHDKSKVKITPLAKKIVGSNQLEIDSVKGTGINEKIVKDDVTPLIAGRKEQSQPASRKRKRLSGIRKVIGDRMQQSVNTAPHVTLTSEIDMSKVKELRTQLLPIIEKQTGYRLSFTEVIVKAVGLVLSRHESVNASLINDEIVYNEEVNIGLAVAVEDGLLVPVLKNVNLKGLAAITTEAKEIGSQARESKLQPHQMKGSTFTISNLGMYAIDAFTPIINLPETAILGVGRIQDKPVVINQAIEIRPMMTISLSFDHRVIDGAPAAAFLTELKRVLENPFELLV